MKLTKEEELRVMELYTYRWPNEDVELIDDEFFWVTPNDAGPLQGELYYPLLGHVCSKNGLDSHSVKFYHKHMAHLGGDNIDPDFKCFCEPCPFPKALRLRVTLLIKRSM